MKNLKDKKSDLYFLCIYYTMPKGVIYMIVNKKTMIVNKKTGQRYIGSTLECLEIRHGNKMRQYQCWLKGGTTKSSNHKLFQNVKRYGGWGNFRIRILKEVYVTSKKQLKRMKGEYIEKYHTHTNGLNMTKAGRTVAEYRKDNQKQN